MSLLCCLRSLVTSTWFLISTILGVLLIEFAMMKTKRVRKVDEARDSKYPSFRRTDTHLWKRWRLYLAAPILIPKIVICVISLSSLLITAKVIVMTSSVKTGEPLSGWRIKVVKRAAQLCGMTCMFFGFGMFWVKKERPQVDWSKYLGPGWKPTYKNPGTIISNHQAWIDIAVHTVISFPSFSPKSGIKKWPIIGEICIYVFSSLFINRSGTHEERERVM